MQMHCIVACHHHHLHDVSSADFDVLAVGTGAAGVRTALMLTETFGLDTSRVVLMERGA